MKSVTGIKGYGKGVPPQLLYVKIYFIQKGYSENEAERFYSHYQKASWRKVHNVPVNNWKVAASEWIWSLRKARNALECQTL